MRTIGSSCFTILGLGFGLVLLSSAASADPTLRYQDNMRGNVRVFGSTFTHNCTASAPVPIGATADCTGQSYLDDTAGDIYWRDNIAGPDILAKDARTSATLELPSRAVVKYARLYWSALKDGNEPDKDAYLDWNGGTGMKIVADHCYPTIKFPFTSHPTWYYYQCSGDATEYVSKWGKGDFRVTDVEAIVLKNTLVHVSYSAWTLVVFFEDEEDEMRNLALFDGFQMIDPEFGPPEVAVTLTGFEAPAGFSAEMTVFAYEGDVAEAGQVCDDRFLVNGNMMSNDVNPELDFFNSSRSYQGKAYSGEYDVPQFSGEPDSMAGYDLDTVDVTSSITSGAKSAVIKATSAYDKFLFGGFVTSITDKAPDFDVTKTYKNVNGSNIVRSGDVIEYTIKAKNVGNDVATHVVITDELEPELAFYSGSIEIVKGGTGGPTGGKTDAKGDDEGDFSAGRVNFRVGKGATPTEGGTVAPNDEVEVKFRAKVTATSGPIGNSAILRASGQSGAPERDFESDGDPTIPGRQRTTFEVDTECDKDSDCSGNKPVCDLQKHICIPCRNDNDCHTAAAPACHSTGRCAECSATNDTLCVDENPVCDVVPGVCIACTPGTSGDGICHDNPDGPICMGAGGEALYCGCSDDADCGESDSGRVCNTFADPQLCINGCRGMGGNGCPSGFECTSKDISIGECVVPKDPG
ncbi:MAG: DUF3344 domain-containing protein, partial [Polyangiaceae bacterium]|nr:DUF3344 domain-containing protein [Polyangiaceae bacterium]